MTVIFKTGQQSENDPFEFVMSDETVDRVGDVIVASGWDLRDFRKNPVALFGHDSGKPPIGVWENVRVEGKRLIGKLKLASAGTSPFIDTLRSLLEQRILRAVSVGFMPTKAEPINPDRPYGPQRFLKTALFECSLVSIPANPNALSLAKGLSEDDRAILFAEPGTRQAARSTRAEPGKIPSNRKGAPMSGLSQRIQESQAIIVGLRDQHTPLAKRIAGEGEELSDDEAAEFDRLSAEIEGEEKNLNRLRLAERSIAGKSIVVPEGGARPATPAVSTSGALIQRKGRPMDLLVRMALVNLVAHAQRQPVGAVLEQRYKDADDLHAVIKAVTNPAMTDVVGWAAELVDTAIADFLEQLQPLSVYAQLAPLGNRFSFDRNGAIKIPRRNRPVRAPGDLRGSFIGEGQPIPVRRGSLGSLNLYPYKLGVISTFTREIAARSTPAIEGIIRQGILEDTAIAVDEALLDASPVIAGVRPAGLLNGVTLTPGAAGGGIDAVKADIQTLVAPFIAANAADGIVLLMNPSDALVLGLMTTPLGVFAFRDELQNGRLLGFRVIQSTTVPEKTVLAIRAPDFASATGDTPEFDVSDVATIHEEDGSYPTNNAQPDPAVAPGPLPITSGPAGTAVVATPVRSLWQTASIGIRMLLDMSWGMRRDGMITGVEDITW